jgi:hypothetical protein
MCLLFLYQLILSTIEISQNSVRFEGQGSFHDTVRYFSLRHGIHAIQKLMGDGEFILEEQGKR